MIRAPQRQKCRSTVLNEATERERGNKAWSRQQVFHSFKSATENYRNRCCSLKRNAHNEWYGACIECLAQAPHRVSRVDDTIESNVSNRFRLMQNFVQKKKTFRWNQAHTQKTNRTYKSIADVAIIRTANGICAVHYIWCARVNDYVHRLRLFVRFFFICLLPYFYSLDHKTVD